MNRLTVRYSGIHVGYKNKYNNSVLCSEMTVPQIRECMEKLAAYEDTGLEPEQIRSFLKDFGISAVMSNTKLRNELKEYKDLEEQGLLIKLPCKVGDMVYCLCNLYEGVPSYKELKIEGMSINYNNLLVYHVGNWNMVSIKDFNKTWFLTREEAEKALEGNE